MEDMLAVCLGLSVIFLILLIADIYRTKQRIREFNRILLEIESGKSNQKFLSKKNSSIDQTGFRLNAILYKYDKLIEEANIAMESNKQLLTSLSHDVRTPMTTLIGYLDAIELNLVGQDKQEEYFKHAREKAYDLREYINELFDWFRLNSEEEVFHMETADVIEATRQILMDWIPVFTEKNIEYEINIPEKSVNVELDGNNYVRILNNILQNILTHSKADKVTITLEEHEKRFIVKIGDNGIGIAREDLKYIFERLYKCNKGRTGKGNGLGLNIAKILTEKMNGEIRAFSEPGNGTMFCVEFPICEKG